MSTASGSSHTREPENGDTFTIRRTFLAGSLTLGTVGNLKALLIML